MTSSFLSPLLVFVTVSFSKFNEKHHDSRRHTCPSNPEPSEPASRVEDARNHGYSPPMIASLRPFAHSRCLRAMGILAWLMLVVTSAIAAPMEMPSQSAQPAEAAASMTGAHCHDGGPTSDSAMGVYHQADCCGSPVALGCQCPTMCISVVPTPLAMIAAVQLSTSYRMPPRIVAPAPNSAPPLRPPLV